MIQSANQERVLIGKIGACYGIKGWLKINAYTEVPEGIFSYSPWHIEVNGQQKLIEVAEWRRHNKGLIAKFDGIDSRSEAEAWLHGEIFVLADQLPQLQGDEYYWRELTGMQVVTTKGYDLGKVSGLMETGSNDVLVVDANPTDAFGKTERLVPFIQEEVIVSVDREANTITVDWDPGF